jgi:hypothetical protein
MIFLGNLSPKEIESRLGITFSQEDKDFLTPLRQETINDTPLEKGKWHCYDIPFMFMCDTAQTAETMKALFMRYYPFPNKITFQIGWER